MKLEPGSRVAHYEIVEMIGRGGMGEVYRATDARLPRDVAVKTSAIRFNDRFSREAKVIASLNHPNICTLFDVGPDFLVMEMIDGATLAQRMADGPMPIDDAIGIMRQVADALEYAHERGVVHRDLKPGNIKIRPDGVVKVLDFGLAKVATAAPAAIADTRTVDSDVTQTGVVLGTTAYMSPEQVLGKPVDKRADVWAFGVVFYELLTGARMHQGDSTQEVMAAVLKDVPDLTKVPPQVRRLLSRCLEKDPNKRLRHVGDVMALLDDVSVGSIATIPSAAATAPAKRPWVIAAAVVGVLAIAAVAAVFLWSRTDAPAQAVGFEVGPAEGMSFNPGAAMTVSPDGRWMVFQANDKDGITRFWLRSLQGPELRTLPGTETIGAQSPPAFWSFDSKWVVFAGGVDRKLMKISLQGGPPQFIADWPGGLNGATWNRDSVILGGTASAGFPILRVSATGGQQPVAATTLAPSETNHLFPQFLPDGKHFIYERVSSDPKITGVYIGNVDLKPEAQSTQRLLETDRQAYYAAVPGGTTGFLVFMRQGTLMTQRFDPTTRTLSGEPQVVPNVGRVDSYSARNYGVFSVSDTGTLVYRAASGAQTRLTWFDASGRAQEAFGDPGDYANPAISPDGRRVAVAVGAVDRRDISIIEVTGARTTRFTFDAARDDHPAWSKPDGRTITFSSARGGHLNLYSGLADSPGQEKLLLETDAAKDDLHYATGGKFLLFATMTSRNARDIAMLALNGGSKQEAVPLIGGPGAQRRPRVSPDGRWLAYTAVESGGPEIWIRQFSPDAPADSGPKWIVSKGGGVAASWRPDSKALYFTTPRAQMMISELDTSGGVPQPLPPKVLFTVPASTLVSGWDLAPDGKRFLFIAEPDSGRTIPFTVKLNWPAELSH